MEQCEKCVATGTVEREGMCFSCWVGVGTAGPIVQWRGGGGYTREDFHERTNAEVIRENSTPESQPAN